MPEPAEEGLRAAGALEQEEPPQKPDDDEETGERKPRRDRETKTKDPCEKAKRAIERTNAIAEQVIREIVREKYKRRSPRKIAEEEEEAIAKFREEESDRENSKVDLRRTTYAKANPGTRGGGASIDRTEAYANLPAYVRYLVDQHEQVHIDDFKTDVLREEVAAIVKARKDLEAVPKSKAGAKQDAQAALTAAINAYEAKLPKTECRAYSNTYHLMKELGDCGYVHYDALLKQIVRVIQFSCASREDAMAALGDDYDKWDEDRKRLGLQIRFGR